MRCKYAYILGVSVRLFDLKHRCADRSLYDIKIQARAIGMHKELSALYSSRRCHNDRSPQRKQPKPGYFRQYRNSGQDVSYKNGTYGHPTV